MSDPTPSPAQPDWFHRRLHDLGTELHDLAVQLAPELASVEHAALAAAAEVWKMASAGLHDLITRNEAEWRDKLTAAIAAYLATAAPLLAPEAGVIAGIVVKVTFDLIDFAESKLAAQAETPLQPIPPPSPAPVAMMAAASDAVAWQ